MNQEVLQYVQKQLAVVDDKLAMLTRDRDGKRYPERYLFSVLKTYVTEFTEQHSENRWIIIPGLRGVGKTTLIAQVIASVRKQHREAPVLFVSLDEVVDLLKAGLQDVLEAYEQILGVSYEKLKQPVFLFIDEVQTDPKWASALKVLYGKTKNVFVICSGSSAVSLQMSADSARRAIVEKLYPMSFSEYELIKHGVKPPKDLSGVIQQALYFSSSAEVAYERLQQLAPQVNQYWSKVDRLDVRQYLMTGTLPFALNLHEPYQVFDAISLLLDKVISRDIGGLGRFDTKTLAAIKRLLLVLAEGEVVSLGKLEELLVLNRLTIAEILDVLEKSELLIRVPAHGANVAVVKKPTKYLFMSPAIRMTFFSIVGIEATLLSRQGRLLEDAVALHYHREFLSRGRGSLSYDSAEGGADFIFRIANKIQIAAEVGMGKKNAKQTAKTMKNIKCNYGVVISQAELGLDRADENILMVPLDYFLLI